MAHVTDSATMIRRRHRAGQFADQYRRALLSAGVSPDLFASPAPRRTWQEIADSHIAVRRGESPDRTRERRSSASYWFRTQRKRLVTGTMTDEQAGYLDEQVPGWREVPQYDWNAAAKPHIQLMQNLGRRPSLSRPHEARSAQWFAMQRRLLRRGELAPERVARLDRQVPGWRPVDVGEEG